MSPLTSKRIESVRMELSGQRRHGVVRNIAGERAVAKLGRERAAELLARADGGDETAASELAAACRE